MKIFALIFIFVCSAHANDINPPKCKPGKKAVFSEGTWVCQPILEESKEVVASPDLKRIADALEKMANGQSNYAPSNSEPSYPMAIPDFITKNGRGITASLIGASWSTGYLAAYRPSLYLAFGLSFLPVDFCWTGCMILAANLAPATLPIAQQITGFNQAPVTFLTTAIGEGIRFVVSKGWEAVGGGNVNRMFQDNIARAAAGYYGQDAFGREPRPLPVVLESVSGGFFKLIPVDPSASGFSNLPTPPPSQAAFPAAAAAASGVN